MAWENKKPFDGSVLPSFIRSSTANFFLAAFPLAEVNEMLTQMDMPGAIVVQSTDRHWLIKCGF